MSKHNVKSSLEQVKQLALGGQIEAADQLCSELIRQHPDSLPLLLLHSQICQQQGQFDRMLNASRQAVLQNPVSVNARIRQVECRIYCGDIERALKELHRLERKVRSDHHLLQKVAGLYSNCTKHHDANRCHELALGLQSGNPELMANLASSCTAIGEINKAEKLLNKVISLRPGDYSAWQNRSALRKQTPDSNHVDALATALNKPHLTQQDQVPLCFALAKEHEDLGNFDISFAYLRRGADQRRSQMRYRVDDDVATMQKLQDVFNRKLLRSAQTGSPEPGPVFILGLPRSGTTLVDRILSSHSRVASLGEVNNLAFAVIGAAGGGGKQELVEKSAGADFARLGKTYRNGTRGYGETAPLLIDKTPSNFLYLALIKLSMPGAKVIHLRRNPMDSCYAMYKTLFRMGYPFSYSFEDLAAYYLAYHRLMQHWRDLMPGFIYDLDYEQLVSLQEETTRSLLDFCALDFEPGCLEFHRNKTAAATASASQVRQPIYSSSVQRWRSYEQQLEPLAARLRDAGVQYD
jgi:Flp pilus assembly protein TadD